LCAKSQKIDHGKETVIKTVNFIHALNNREFVALLEKARPIPVAGQSKAWACGRSLAGIAGSNPSGGMDGCLCIVSVACCHVEVSASG
jgi:hypothetical protein